MDRDALASQVDFLVRHGVLTVRYARELLEQSDAQVRPFTTAVYDLAVQHGFGGPAAGSASADTAAGSVKSEREANNAWLAQVIRAGRFDYDTVFMHQVDHGSGDPGVPVSLRAIVDEFESASPHEQRQLRGTVDAMKADAPDRDPRRILAVLGAHGAGLAQQYTQGAPNPTPVPVVPPPPGLNFDVGGNPVPRLPAPAGDTESAFERGRAAYDGNRGQPMAGDFPPEWQEGAVGEFLGLKRAFAKGWGAAHIAAADAEFAALTAAEATRSEDAPSEPAPPPRRDPDSPLRRPFAPSATSPVGLYVDEAGVLVHSKAGPRAPKAHRRDPETGKLAAYRPKGTLRPAKIHEVTGAGQRTGVCQLCGRALKDASAATGVGPSCRAKLDAIDV